MEQIPDDPRIRDAEINGVGYSEPTEEEYRSKEYQEAVLEGYKEALDDAQKAIGWLEGMPEGTIWDQDIYSVIVDLEDVCMQIESRIKEVKAWEAPQ